MKTVMRLAIPTDIPFIYSTWLKSYRYDSAIGKDCRNSTFFDEYKLVIDGILNDPRTNVHVMVKEDEPNVVFSYCVSSPGTIHYCYTKEDFRRFGLVRRMLEETAAIPMPLLPEQLRTVTQSNTDPVLANAHNVPDSTARVLHSSGSLTGMRGISIICTHKTFLSRPIFAKYADLLVYNPFSLYKKERT